MEDKLQAGEVDAVAALAMGQGGGDVAEAVRVCHSGAEGIPRPRGERHYQGRIVVGHMRATGEAPA